MNLNESTTSADASVEEPIDHLLIFDHLLYARERITKKEWLCQFYLSCFSKRKINLRVLIYNIIQGPTPSNQSSKPPRRMWNCHCTRLAALPLYLDLYYHRLRYSLTPNYTYNPHNCSSRTITNINGGVVNTHNLLWLLLLLLLWDYWIHVATPTCSVCTYVRTQSFLA